MALKITQPQVLGAPRVSADVSPELLGGPTVRFQESLGKAAGEINDFMLARQDQLDVIAVMTAEAEWTIAEDSKMQDFMSRKGENAFDMLGEAEQWFDGYGSEPPAKPGEKRTSGAKIGPGGRISEGFRDNRYGKMNDRQKMAFDRLRTKRRSSFLKSIGSHETKERFASIIRSSDSLIASHTADAIRNYLRPEQMKENISRIDASVKAKAAAAGLSQEEVERDREVAMSTIHEGVLTQYLASDDHEGASAYLKKHKGALEGKSLPMMQSAIRAKKITTEGLRHAREAMKMTADKRDAYLDKITDADIAKEAWGNMYRMSSQETKAKAFARKQAQGSVYTKIWEKDKGGNYVLPDLKTVVGTEVWTKLDASDQETFRTMLIARDTEYPTVRPEDSLTEMNGLYEMSREDFLAKFNPVEYFGKLSERDMNTMKSRHDRFTQEGQDEDWADIDKQTTDRMQTFGWSTGAGDAPRMGAFREAARKKQSDWLRTHKNEKPTATEWRAELDSMSTSEQRKIEKQFARPRPKAVGTEGDPRTQENMTAAFADANWRNPSDGKPEKFYDIRKGQLKIIIDKKVAAFKKENNGYTPKEDWYQREIHKVGNDLVFHEEWGGDPQVLAGSIEPGTKIRNKDGKVTGYKPSEAEEEHYVTVTDAFPDKEYTVGYIEKWRYEHPEEAAKIGAKMAGEGRTPTNENLASEIYKWEKAQETKTPDIRSPIRTTPKKPKVTTAPKPKAATTKAKVKTTPKPKVTIPKKKVTQRQAQEQVNAAIEGQKVRTKEEVHAEEIEAMETVDVKAIEKLILDTVKKHKSRRKKDGVRYRMNIADFVMFGVADLKKAIKGKDVDAYNKALDKIRKDLSELGEK